MRRLALFPVLLLAACDGTAPAVAPPPTLGQPLPACTANTPPPGYSGPISPFTGPCPAPAMTAPRPSGTWDYSHGDPPRAVRGQ